MPCSVVPPTVIARFGFRVFLLLPPSGISPPRRFVSSVCRRCSATAATGTFSFGIIMAQSSGGDPCTATGARLTEHAAVIRFQPEGDYDHDAHCVWGIDCGSSAPLEPETRTAPLQMSSSCCWLAIALM